LREEQIRETMIPVGKPLAESLGEMIPLAERSPTIMVLEVPGNALEA
jgi:hypothetical protein